MDNVRGYEDNEINRLVSGEDTSEARVDDKAYMINLKIEPRVFLSDSTMLGIFYDAGRVFVDEYDLSRLRSSVGFSFKYLTPVGSLDFDYGIKLLRKRDSDGRLESPGRLHVSIGFF
jgi:outer membrane protein insertion porin family